jgi:hypothetical protein
LTCPVGFAAPATGARRETGSSQNLQNNGLVLPRVGKLQRFDLQISAMEVFG